MVELNPYNLEPRLEFLNDSNRSMRGFGGLSIGNRRNKLVWLGIAFAASAIYVLDVEIIGINSSVLYRRSLRAKIDIYPEVSKAAKDGLKAMRDAGDKLMVTSWNTAAINNNPFEYWITYKGNPAYDELMVDIEQFIEKPGKKDIPVSEVFTQKMFDQLDSTLQEIGWESVRSYWEEDFQDRNIVSEFLKDPVLGKKRLASMPDRVTNTIRVKGSDDPACRPTVINMFDGDLSTTKKWWKEWQEFMFSNKLKIGGKNGDTLKKFPYEMLQPIKKSKYPDVTTKEEKDSLPLQTLCIAIFDAILVHMMNTVSNPDIWQPLKEKLVESLNKEKITKTIEILQNEYIESDIITLQEVSSAFIDQARESKLGKKFHMIAPKDIDTNRDQNSIIMLQKTSFPDGESAEVTKEIIKAFPSDEEIPVSKGDILAVATMHKDKIPMIIASFHGDTDGLATKPVLKALMKAKESDPELASAKLIFGLDANTYEEPANPEKQEDVLDWGKHYQKYGLTSCWGGKPQASNYTTYNARTYLQTQLNKACKKSEKRTKGDVNPKDFILFDEDSFIVKRTWKDNTGTRKFIEDMAFPTLEFPSDHGIVTTLIQPVDPTKQKQPKKKNNDSDDEDKEDEDKDEPAPSVEKERKLSRQKEGKPFRETVDKLGLKHTGSIGIPSKLMDTR